LRIFVIVRIIASMRRHISRSFLPAIFALTVGFLICIILPSRALFVERCSGARLALFLTSTFSSSRAPHLTPTGNAQVDFYHLLKLHYLNTPTASLPCVYRVASQIDFHPPHGPYIFHARPSGIARLVFLIFLVPLPFWLFRAKLPFTFEPYPDGFVDGLHFNRVMVCLSAGAISFSSIYAGVPFAPILPGIVVFLPFSAALYALTAECLHASFTRKSRLP